MICGNKLAHSAVSLCQSWNNRLAFALRVTAAGFNRPVCELLAGDLMSLAEQLGVMEKTQEFIHELKNRNQQPRGPFSGVTGY